LNKNSIIIDIVKKLDRKEFRELGDFVRSPFHNKSKNAINLYKYMESHYPEFNEKSMGKKAVFHSITGKEKYNDGLMRIILHSFRNLLEEFLIQINLKKNPHQKEIFLLNELNIRKYEKLFTKSLKNIQKELEIYKYKNYDYYKLKYEIDLSIKNYGSWKRYKSKDFKDLFEHIDLSMVNNFISYFLAVSLSFYRFQLFKQQTVGFKGNFKMMEEILLFLENEGANFMAIPVIKLHYNEILILKENNESSFYILKNILVKENELIPHDLRYSTHNILQLYCINRIFKGEPSFAGERLELYKIAIEQNLFKRTYVDYFDEILFLSIFTVAYGRRDFKWADEFLQKHKKQLSPDNKTFIEGYCNAKLCHARGRLNDALKIVESLHHVKHWQYKVLIRDLTLMIYYELGWMNEAIAQLDAYRHYLKTIKPKFSASKFERIMMFIKIFGKLIRIKEKKDKDKALTLLLEFNKISNINERDWLGIKINGLAK